MSTSLVTIEVQGNRVDTLMCNWKIMCIAEEMLTNNRMSKILMNSNTNCL